MSYSASKISQKPNLNPKILIKIYNRAKIISSQRYDIFNRIFAKDWNEATSGFRKELYKVGDGGKLV